MASERKMPQKATKTSKPKQKPPSKRRTKAEADGLATLQRQVGNRAVQRLVGQRADQGTAQTGGQLSESMSARLDRSRGDGQPLEQGVRQRMRETTGYDLEDVRVHTDAEAGEINRQLDARAFTTGQDIFFGEGQYNPHSSDGQELIAHETTHVIQQRQGKVQGAQGRGMRVNAPGDLHEQQADAVAKKIVAPGSEIGRQDVSAGTTGAVQRQDIDEEMGAAKAVQRQDLEEDLGAAKVIQRQDLEEELGAAKAVQRQDLEKELGAAKAVQRQDIEEDLGAAKAIQRQDLEEDLGMAQAVQRQVDTGATQTAQRKPCDVC